MQPDGRELAGMTTLPTCLIACVILFGMILSPSARAETQELRLGSGFGIHYLPFYVLEHESLIEKHAKLAGLPGLKATYSRISGGGALNTAILSGSVDIVGAGIGPFAIIWDKSFSNLRVKALSGSGDIPLVLLTNDPRIHSLGDIRDGDRIALPAVKASMQATLLQMAVANLKGDTHYSDLDQNTVTLPHSDALAAMVSHTGIVNLHFSVAPYSTRELRDPAIHQILDSPGIVGGPSSINLTFATTKFHDANPMTCQVFLAALAEAMQIIKADPALAARIYMESDKAAGADAATIEKILRDPAFDFTINPHGVGKIVGFMHETGVIQHNPGNWRNLFFDEATGLDGN